MSETLPREPRRSRQFWLDHVESWKVSGLSKAVYCQQHGLKAGSFYNWSRKISPTRSWKDSSVAPLIESPLKFLPLTLTPSHAPSAQLVQVIRSATEISLPTDLTAEQIDRWLCAIHQLHV